jgi:acetyltransferase-like isoleucine patch superfamily enzyme
MRIISILNSYKYRKRFPKTNISPKSSISGVGNIEIGEYTYGVLNIRCWDQNDTVKIGKFCSIAEGVKIFGGGEHNKSLVSTYPLKHFLFKIGTDPNIKSKGATIIGNDVWIGENAIILSGVKIGDGCIIGAGSVVAKEIPSYAIAAGNPAKIIGYRFEKEIIKKLQNISWWNWPVEKIKMNIEIFYKDAEFFVKVFYEGSKN